MANALLDFVMSLVRDPDAAARYAADPAGAIADAHLVDVTSADVQNLIPVVTESFSMSVPTAMPSHSVESFEADPAGNIWTSGAATAAFDAFGDFGDQLPTPAGFDTDPAVPTIVDELDPGFDALTDDDVVETATSLQVDDPAVDDILTNDAVVVDDWVQPIAHEPVGDHTPGFDLFD